MYPSPIQAQFCNAVATSGTSWQICLGMMMNDDTLPLCLELVQGQSQACQLLLQCGGEEKVGGVRSGE
jgi:hypothetical protein